jgi:hypothetical protein
MANDLINPVGAAFVRCAGWPRIYHHAGTGDGIQGVLTGEQSGATSWEKQQTQRKVWSPVADHFSSVHSVNTPALPALSACQKILNRVTPSWLAQLWTWPFRVWSSRRGPAQVGIIRRPRLSHGLGQLLWRCIDIQLGFVPGRYANHIARLIEDNLKVTVGAVLPREKDHDTMLNIPLGTPSKA